MSIQNNNCSKCNKLFTAEEEVYRVIHHVALVKMKKTAQGLWPSAMTSIEDDRKYFCKNCYENNA